MENETIQKAPARKPDAPVRRVGSITLGIALIAAGGFFLLYYFVPGFPWLLTAKLSPLLVVALGVEVLVCSFRAGRAKYDFLAVLSCLVLMGAGFCATLLPMLWEYAGPERDAKLQGLSDQYADALYEAFTDSTGPAVLLRSMKCWIDLPFGSTAPETLEALPGDAAVVVHIEMAGPYRTEEAFAADCGSLLDAVKAQAVRPDSLSFFYNDAAGGRYALDLDARVQLDWPAERLAQEVEAAGMEQAEAPEAEAAAAEA